MDKTGKLVTRHVRNSPKPTLGSSAIPAPSLYAAPQTSSAAQLKNKLRPKQTRQQEYTMRASRRCDPALSEQWDSIIREYQFKASDVEIYDVCSVIKPVDDTVLKVLVAGARTHEEAIRYLQEKGADHLIGDYSENAEEALKVGLNASAFLDASRFLPPRMTESPAFLDIARFDDSSLSKSRSSGWIRKALAEGNLDFDAVSFIGILNLKNKNAEFFSDRVVSAYNGEADYSIEDMKAVLEKVNSEEISQTNRYYVPIALDNRGADWLLKQESLGTAMEVFGFAHATRIGVKWEDKAERTDYMLALYGNKDIRNSQGLNSINSYYEAGIPLEVAERVMLQGGDLNDAKAISEGVSPSVSSGWL